MNFIRISSGLILCASALLTSYAGASEVVIDRLEASVNSSLVTLSDVHDFRRTLRLRAQLDPLFAGTSLAARGNQIRDREIVDFLVPEKLIAQQFAVSDSEVEQEINLIQNNNRITRSTLVNALKDQGFTFDDYFELIRMSASKRNLIDREIRTKVTISDDDVKNHFYNHYARNLSGSFAYRVQIITISPSSYKTPTAAKEAAQSALQSIRSGESFEEVARRLSDHPTASGGGDLGTLPEDQFAPVIREQLKKLQIGEVSEIFGSPKTGYFIVKLVDKQNNEMDQFKKVKEEIRNQLAAAEYQHQISLWIERQRQTAFIHRAGESSSHSNSAPAR